MNKVNIKFNNLNYTNCLFIESLDDYKNYLIEFNNKFKVSENEIITRGEKGKMGHDCTILTSVAEMLTDNTESALSNLKLLQGKLLANQLTDILNNKKLVINKKGGYFSIKPTDKYEVIYINNCKYTEKDININKWMGGRHYYAKIGTIDVIDDDGNVKWNTEQYAYDMALKYMKQLNNR